MMRFELTPSPSLRKRGVTTLNDFTLKPKVEVKVEGKFLTPLFSREGPGVSLKIFLFLFFFFLQNTILAQSNQHRFYIYWGWNRGYFSKSDIQFKSDHYDFTLSNVIAKDRQTPFSFDVYFHPTKLTIPQTNYGIGYYWKNNYILTLAVDHMKYVVQQNQNVIINGFIHNTNPTYDGTYTSESILIQPDFLKMEHTDGLNYIALGISRSDNLFQKISSLKNKLELNLVEGIETGFLMPRTDVTVLNQPTRNTYHVSGLGVSLKTGLHFTFFKHYFIHGEIKGGYINLFDIPTSPDGKNKAEQDFYFLQTTIQFGGIFYLKRKEKQ